MTSKDVVVSEFDVLEQLVKLFPRVYAAVASKRIRVHPVKVADAFTLVAWVGCKWVVYGAPTSSDLSFKALENALTRALDTSGWLSAGSLVQQHLKDARSAVRKADALRGLHATDIEIPMPPCLPPAGGAAVRTFELSDSDPRKNGLKRVALLVTDVARVECRKLLADDVRTAVIVTRVGCADARRCPEYWVEDAFEDVVSWWKAGVR